MKFIISKETGSIYRLKDGVLEFAPLYMGDSSLYEDSDFGMVELDKVGEEVITVYGKEMTISEFAKNIIEQLS